MEGQHNGVDVVAGKYTNWSCAYLLLPSAEYASLFCSIRLKCTRLIQRSPNVVLVCRSPQ